MPGKIRKLPGRNKYRVWWGGKVTAKETTLENAKKQLRVLGMARGKKS